jgi:putative oxidoreductase
MARFVNEPGPYAAGRGQPATAPQTATQPRTAWEPRGQSSAGIAPLLGRLLICQIFLMSGVYKIFDWAGTDKLMTEQFGRALGWIDAAPGMSELILSAIPFFLGAAIVFEVGGGLCLLLGFRTRLGAAALILFLIPTTLIFHSFWMLPEAEQQLQMIMFMKNLAIIGGLFMVFGCGPGRLSVDARRWNQ